MTEFEPLFFDIEATGVNPIAKSWAGSRLDAQVLCVGFGRIMGWREGEEYSYDVDTIYGASEYELLRKVKQRFSIMAKAIRQEGKTPVPVMFNGKQYDYPYLGARYLRYNQRPPTILMDHKRLDLMYAIKEFKGDFKNPSQGDIAKEHGVLVEDEFDGSDIPRLFEEDRWEDIESHARCDVEELIKIFKVYRDVAFQHFYDHYDIAGEPTFGENKEL